MTPNKFGFNLIFRNTTNSYKYYWWLAILQQLKKNDNGNLKYDELAIQMVCMAWYPIVYFKISFGKTDQLSKFVQKIKDIFPSLDDEIKPDELEFFLLRNKNKKELKKILTSLTKYVPFRFVRPWYPETKGSLDQNVHKIILTKQKISNTAPYFIKHLEKELIINDNWRTWIMDNYKIIKSFTFYELFKFTEKNNKHSTNISTKLFPPTTRTGLHSQTRLWREFVVFKKNSKCVFENEQISELSDLSIDHFIPWSFTTHDELWNLHPMDKSNNSAKNNTLPSEIYLRKFSTLQYHFMQFLASKNTSHLNEYCTILNLNEIEIRNISEEQFVIALTLQLKSLLIKAENMGFESNWQFSSALQSS